MVIIVELYDFLISTRLHEGTAHSSFVYGYSMLKLHYYLAMLYFVDNFVNASHMRFQIPFLPEKLMTNRTTKLGWNIIATHCMFLQMMFKFE